MQNEQECTGGMAEISPKQEVEDCGPAMNCATLLEEPEGVIMKEDEDDENDSETEKIEENTKDYTLGSTSSCGMDFAEDLDPALIQGLILKLKKKAKAIRPKKFTCNECPFKAHKGAKLRNHVEKVHLKIKNYHCSDCSFSAYDNSTLKQHINSVHLKIKRFSCSICGGFQAYVASAVRAHQRAAHMKTGPILPIEQGDVPTMSTLTDKSVLPIEQRNVPTMNTSTNETIEEGGDNSADHEMGDAFQSKTDEGSDPASNEGSDPASKGSDPASKGSDPASNAQEEESEGDPAQVQ